MWARSLFQRIKGTVLRFQTMKELLDSEAGKTVSTLTFLEYDNTGTISALSNAYTKNTP